MAISNNSTGLRPGVCTSTTRPTAPYEGQMIYETDTDMLGVWNGSSWRYFASSATTNGTVLQVQSTTMSDTQVVSAKDTWTTITNLQATITPKSASSKIFVTVDISYGGGDNIYGAARLVRGSTVIAIGDAASTRTRVTAPLMVDNDASSGSAKLLSASLSFLDSPATVSSTAYKLEVWNDSAVGGGALNINRSGNDSTNTFYMRGVSTITLMEIAG